ncbi:DUF1501 domain-containing protein [Aureliella helgolandensis]|uniref:Sulfatase n=1 Tax=Aureliella helgolandensis TaxID=2527968 RepID=A0A518GA83_9BACT|nr:DUF1501 domain-containing protein [Aureliella helgolandensis]QDV25492.1 hypothetical protein Q31a_38180 [Aureliella helgolandensis]
MMKRRNFLTRSAALAAAPIVGAGSPLLAAPTPVHIPKGKAEHCIFIWLGGGMCQLDTFDPKRRGNPRSAPKVAGSDYTSIDTVVPGVKFTEHLSRTAKVADRLTAIRSVNHSVIDDHAFATNIVHTGRMISGTITYPSIGSLVAHQRGAASEDVPAYMLIGYPNVSRGPGYLGPSYSNVYLTDTESGPAGFTQPEGLSATQIERRQRFAAMAGGPTKEMGLARYAEIQEQARRWAGADFMRNFKLDEEPAALREEYGGEFGQRCLLARRLTQSGVRFVEVSHNLNFINGTGWDTHFEGQLNQHVLIQELDTALAALIRDLEKKGLLDKTLIATGTEFGRPAEFDNRGGRGHQGSAFSLVLAGGGLNHCGAYGASDDHLGKEVAENPVSVPDFHATMFAALGIDPTKELFDSGRPIPITDGGNPITALFG